MVMNERNFVTQKREDWDRLAALVEKANGPRGVRALQRDEVQALGPLYRRASSDLAYARARAVNTDLVQHLNGLVGKAHALLYEAETSEKPATSVLNFYLYDFPALLQRRAGYFLAALGVSLLGVAFAYWLVITHPARLDLFVPPGFKSSVDIWKSGKVTGDPSAEQSGWLMQHNLTVGLVAFASGVFCVLPALAALFTNGAMLGAMAALMTQVHHHDTFWPGILPHGIAELTAIFICGAAGIQIGMSVLLPGPYARADAFRVAGLEGIRLVLGTIPLFIFAGIIEGMFSHLPLPATIRLTFAGINGVIWYLYLFLPRKRPTA
jgi:uncharacterized membrane protein SpoIIM required for sporulation